MERAETEFHRKKLLIDKRIDERPKYGARRTLISRFPLVKNMGGIMETEEFYPKGEEQA